MRTSLKDIAEAAGGVSVATVSYALRGAPEVSEATRARILAIASEMGYTPRPEIAQLASRRWKNRSTGGLKVAYITHNQVIKQGGRLYHTVVKTARLRGFDAEAFCPEDYPSGEKLAKVLKARGIEALVVSPLFDKKFAAEFPWHEFTGINVETGYFAPNYNHVFPALLEAGCEAYKRCRNKGYERIGFAWICEEVTPLDHWEKQAAFLLCQEEASKEGLLLKNDHFSITPLMNDFRAWIQANQLDAVIVQTPTFYYSGLAKATGQRAVGCVCLNILPSEKQHTGFILDFELLLNRAWLELDMQLRNYQRGLPASPTRCFVSMPWNDGSTLCPK